MVWDNTIWILSNGSLDCVWARLKMANKNIIYEQYFFPLSSLERKTERKWWILGFVVQNDNMKFDFLQFADAEAYFAPCTTDTTVNNCLVSSSVAEKYNLLSEDSCCILHL